MNERSKVFIIFFLVSSVQPSPFDLTEKYIQDYELGIANLKALAKQTVLGEGTFDPSHYDEETALKEAEEFDFIVVGAGSSGAVLANRLSEIPEWKVLLLEAGAPESKYAQAPALTDVLLNTPYNWGYKTEPQEKTCFGYENNQCSISTGRALGGTSAINRMLYTRGNAKDYDIWADLGNEGWCYKDVLPYFKKSEDAHLHKFDRKHHSQGGLLYVEEPRHNTDVAEAFLQAGHELGYKTIDYNGEEQLGFAIPQLLTKKGTRNSVSKGYLKTAENRKNLIVRPLSQVIKILIAPHTKEAQGVQYVHDGKLFVAKNKKDVILSAGAINTPQILLLSGIGLKEDLNSKGLECLHELPVGDNLRDHIAFYGLNFLLNETIKEENHRENLVAWLKDGLGPLSHVGIEALAYLQTEASKDGHTYPDVELLLLPHAFNIGYEPIKNEYGVAKILYDTVWAPTEGKRGFTIAIVLLHPKSVGNVKLKSKDPFHYPIINANYLTDEEGQDLQTILAGIRKVLALAETESFQKLGAQLTKPHLLSCETHEFGSDGYWKCAVRHLTVSLGNPSGTCKMGPKTDKEAIVDNHLKVYGIGKLRVVDASVVPVGITAQSEAVEVLIGEKAADIIKHDWN